MSPIYDNMLLDKICITGYAYCNLYILDALDTSTTDLEN